MKTITKFAFSILLGLSASVAHADQINGEQEIQRIEHALNTTLELSAEEKLPVIMQYSLEISKLIEAQVITADRAELALDFIDRYI